MDSEPTYADQSALYGTTEPPPALPGGRVDGTRSFFIVDKSRMMQETDTLEKAKVVYLPESEFRKDQYHDRCRYLIGVADVYRNFSGKFPQFFTMTGSCYACKLLEPNYFMFLLGRPSEPGKCVLRSLQHIYNIFHFYYCSADAVMSKSRSDWETFTTNMTFIFQKISNYVFRDTHCIPFMFKTLPYSQGGRKNTNQSRLFLLASRLLRSCQQHKPIIGGCVLHDKKIVCNQLPPELMEKVQLVGGEGIELNTKSVLADNVAPETVWVVEVYLSPHEVETLEDVQHDLPHYQRTYHDLTPNTTLVDSAFAWKFQSTTSNKSVGKPRLKKLSKSSATRRSQMPSRAADHDSPVVDEDYYNLPPITITDPRALHADSVAEDRQSLQLVESDDTAVYIVENSAVLMLSPKNRMKSRENSTSPSKTATGEVGRGRPGSAKHSLVRKGGRGEKGQAESNREMPQLHNTFKRIHHDPTYDDPDEFLDKISPPVSSASPQTRTKPHEPLIQSPSLDDVIHDDHNRLPPFPTIPTSLSIPITAGGQQADVGSTRQSATGSSVEDERFATPSPTFPAPYNLQSSTGQSLSIPIPAPILETSSCVDRSNSFQTADESSSHSLSPPAHQRQGELLSSSKEKKVPSIYDSPPLIRPPKKTVTSTPASTSSRPLPALPPRSQLAVSLLEDSDDFMDSDFVDQLIAQVQLEAEEEVMALHSSASNWQSGGGGRGRSVGKEEHMKNRPLPKPPTECGTAALGDAEVSPPQLPPRFKSMATTGDQLVPPVSTDQSQLAGDSGEFVVENSRPPPVPPKKVGMPTEKTVESKAEEEKGPPPPLRSESHKMREMVQEVSAGFVSKRARVADDETEADVPPIPPPRDQLHLRLHTEERNLAEGSSDKSTSSSPDVQHRDLTQLDRQGASSVDSQPDRDKMKPESAGEGEGEGAAEKTERDEGEWQGDREGEGGEGGESVREKEEGGREEAGEEEVDDGEGENAEDGEKGSGSSVKYDRSNWKRTSTCVDPVGSYSEEKVKLTEFPKEDKDALSNLVSSGKTLTSDEESDDEVELHSTLKYGLKSAIQLSDGRLSEERETPILDVEGSELEGEREENGHDGLLRVRGPDVSGSGGEMSISGLLTTPETTLQLSALRELRPTSETDLDNPHHLLDSVNVRSRSTTMASDLGEMVRPRAGSTWLQTLGRQLQPPELHPTPRLETRCLYVQRHSKTVIVLAAEAGLQNNHTLLTNLWKELLPQLIVLDQGLLGEETEPSHRGYYNMAVYRNSDQFCAVENPKALYIFRHAIRHTHLEYERKPDLCQVSLVQCHSESTQCRMMSQKVVGRETFYHHQKPVSADVFYSTSHIMKAAKQMGDFPLGSTPSPIL